RGGDGVGAVGLAAVALGAERLPGVGRDGDARAGVEDGAHEAEGLDAEGAEEAAGDGAGGDAGGGLTGAGALERCAAVGGEPLGAAGEVGVAWAGTVDGGRAQRVVDARILVGDAEGQGGADGAAAAHAGDDLDAVLLDALSAAAAVAA